MTIIQILLLTGFFILIYAGIETVIKSVRNNNLPDEAKPYNDPTRGQYVNRKNK